MQMNMLSDEILDLVTGGQADAGAPMQTTTTTTTSTTTKGSGTLQGGYKKIAGAGAKVEHTTTESTTVETTTACPTGPAWRGVPYR